MFKDIFSKDRINIGRQDEIDLLKAYSIVMMILTHCIDDLFVYEGHVFAEIVDDVLAQIVGAQGFMICMGLGIIYSRKATARGYVNRGISLLITGQVLHLFDIALPGILMYLSSGSEEVRKYTFLVFSSDIMQFAGLFFLCMGLFTYLKLKPLHIFIISVVLNCIGTVIYGRISTGSYAVDQFIGLFIFTNTESYFPLIHWMIFPSFGLLLGNILQHVKDKRKFYGIMFFPSAAVFAAYLIIEKFIDLPIFMLIDPWQSFCYMRIFDAIPSIISNMAIFSLCYFIIELLHGRGVEGIRFISKNINKYYCIHLTIILPISMYLIFFGGGYFENAALMYLMAVLIFSVCTGIIIVYNKYCVKTVNTIIGKYRLLFYGLVIVLSVIICIWAYQGDAGFYNLTNEYNSRW